MMTEWWPRSIPLIVALALALVLGGCDQYSLYGALEPQKSGAGGTSDTPTGGTTPPPSGSTLAIQPPAVAVGMGGSCTFLASGGAAPYLFQVTTGGGSVDSVTGSYAAPASAGTAVVTVTDGAGAPSTAKVTIVGAPELAISPAALEILSGQTYQFSASGGVPPYGFSVPSGGGSVASGLYTAPAAAGSATVRVTDAQGMTRDATVTIDLATPALAVSPMNFVVPQNGTAVFTGHGGVPGTPKPYSYSASGGGTINVNNGQYGAGGAPIGLNTVTITVTDSVPTSVSTFVTILPAAPSGLVATALANRTIRLSWTNNATGATSIIVEQSDDPISTSSYAQVASLAATATSYTTGVLPASSFHRFRIFAGDATGTLVSPYSNEAYTISSP